jgi:hypothetical protein
MPIPTRKRALSHDHIKVVALENHELTTSNERRSEHIARLVCNWIALSGRQQATPVTGAVGEPPHSNAAF